MNLTPKPCSLSLLVEAYYLPTFSAWGHTEPGEQLFAPGEPRVLA
jgi:hypothetical protein